MTKFTYLGTTVTNLNWNNEKGAEYIQGEHLTMEFRIYAFQSAI